ncbi:MAG: GDSL-type esterase/lipase family protein [Adhaeribacter sp.]
MKPEPNTRTIETRLGGIWAILLAFCLNPWLVAYLLTADGHFESGKVPLLLGFISATLILYGFLSLAQKIRLSAAFNKILLLLASGFIAFYCTVLADRLLGKLLLPPAQNLIFPANSAVKYNTPEFNVTAHINSLGFRDREYSLDKENKFRVIVIGDSFTFGWGVDIQDTWVKLLEKKFRKENPEIEIFNLGRSGGSPETYEAIAAQAVPVLQPDLVMIALLQGNDLQQLLPTTESETTATPAPKLNLRRLLNIATANAYPNILRLLAATTLQTEVKPVWQEQAAFITQHFTPAEKTRFKNLDATAKQLFLNGELNPDLVYSLLKDPEIYLHLQNIRSAGVQQAQQKLAQHLNNIRKISTQHDARLLTLTVPNKYYLCEKAMREHTALGATVDTSIISSNIPDSLAAAVTKAVGIPFYSATAALQNHCPTQKLYYTYDSHFTPLGNKLFAEAIFAELKEPVKAIISKKK